MEFFPNRTAGLTLALSLSSDVFAQHYTQINLDSNVSGAVESVDSQLINSLRRWNHAIRRIHLGLRIATPFPTRSLVFTES
jgi:hypothetical protein